MRVPGLARWGALAGLAAALIGAAPALSSAATAVDRLPACAPAGPSTEAPAGPAGPHSPGACRAHGRAVESGLPLARPSFTPSGYHHLGANTAGVWRGISGRMSVVNSAVRPGSYDFVAGRFMAKRDMGGGRIAWLEAGWAETGWASPGRQHVYTFNTNTNTWQFYDQYTLKPGERAWVDVHTDAAGIWGAWLWWGNRWNLLTAQRLPIGATAYMEQYVEVHVDPRRAARVDVPSVTVDNVRLRPAGGGPARLWRADVPTLTGSGLGAGSPSGLGGGTGGGLGLGLGLGLGGVGVGVGAGQQQRTGGFCLNWINRYDTWTAGDCP